jgi:hypothetical protein
VEPELRDALDQATADLRSEIRAGDAETRETLDRVAGELRGEIRAGDAETRETLDRVAGDLRGEIRAAVVEMRRHFDVAGESLRSDIRGIAEGMALLSQHTDVRLGEQAERTDRLEGRMLRLEARVSSLEDDRRSGRPRRR